MAVQHGVLEWQPSSRWALPTFIMPKKDSTCRTISDFRELNKCIVRKLYLIPKISTILQELEGYTYATALDLNMGYYTIRLDPTASEMCTIIFPWGKYSYKRLPMGFWGSADIFQAQIMDLTVKRYSTWVLLLATCMWESKSMQVQTMIQCLDKRSHNYILCEYDYLNVTPRAKAAQGH